jgi:hypothetical protein
LYYGDDYRLHSAPAGNEWLAELTLKLELV